MKKTSTLIEDRKQNINLFKDINDLENFSKYSYELNKIFSYHSFSKFLRDLSNKDNKKGITFKDQIYEWINLTNPSKSKKKIEPFDIDKFKSDLKKMEIKELSLHQKKKQYYEKRTYRRKLLFNSTKNKILEIKNKNKKLQAADIGKYNPKYDVIRSHTYQVFFGKQNFYEFNANTNSEKNINFDKTKSALNFRYKTAYNSKDKEYKNLDLNFKTIDQNKNNNNAKTQTKFILKNKSDNSNLSFKINNMKSNKTLPNQAHRNNLRRKELTLQNLSYRNKLNNNKSNLNDFNLNNKDEVSFYPKIKKMKLINSRSKYEKNEASLLNSNSYSKYSNKNTLNTLNNKTIYNKKANYTKRNYSSTNSKRKLYFNKIITNKKMGYLEEVAKKNKNPPVGVYEPNYSTIFARTTNVFLPKKIKNKNLKKNLINKILANYHITTGYEILDSLNDNNNRNNNTNNNKNYNLLTMMKYLNLNQEK